VQPLEQRYVFKPRSRWKAGLIRSPVAIAWIATIGGFTNVGPDLGPRLAGVAATIVFVIPFTVGFSWLAVQRWRYGWVLVASEHGVSIPVVAPRLYAWWRLHGPERVTPGGRERVNKTQWGEVNRFDVVRESSGTETRGYCLRAVAVLVRDRERVLEAIVTPDSSTGRSNLERAVRWLNDMRAKTERPTAR